VEEKYKIMSKTNIMDFESIMMNNASLMKILEDGVVTEEEIMEQSQKVMDLIAKLEQTCTQEQLQLIQEFIAEMNALYVAYNYNELLSIR
jgi:hypothetical protein